MIATGNIDELPNEMCQLREAVGGANQRSLSLRLFFSTFAFASAWAFAGLRVPGAEVERAAIVVAFRDAVDASNIETTSRLHRRPRRYFRQLCPHKTDILYLHTIRRNLCWLGG
jgi:hypothetical protein